MVAPLRRADDEARANLSSARGVDARALVVLLGSALLLTVQSYFCPVDEIGRTLSLLRALGAGEAADRLRALLERDPLAPRAWWALGTCVCYLLLPALLVRLVLRERLAEYGLRLRGAFADAWLYAVVLAVMAPLILVVSADAQFQKTYPFYRPAGGAADPWFWCWEGLYALQFVSVEFFFRGFLVHGLRHRFGAYAILVMVVPYCMIHFNKPLAEALGSVVAGLVLGFLSLKTRSVAPGVVLHVTAALGMDLASLWRQGAI